MEHIKEALEKAKTQQLTANADGRQVSTGMDTKSGSDAVNLGSINYQHTRVVNLDQEILEHNRIIAHNKNNLHSSHFDLLRTQVLQKMDENGWRTLGITSPTPEAGKTVVAINLAMSIAQHAEKTTMLVDFDLRRPSVAKYLGLSLENSLEDVLRGNCDVRDALVNPGIPRFVILAALRSVQHSAELLASSRVKQFIEEVRDLYEERIVIFDLPPLLNADDAMTVLPKIDCVLMVVANGMSTQHEIEESLRHLPTTNLLGTVLNKAQRESHPYAYRD